MQKYFQTSLPALLLAANLASLVTSVNWECPCPTVACGATLGYEGRKYAVDEEEESAESDDMNVDFATGSGQHLTDEEADWLELGQLIAALTNAYDLAFELVQRTRQERLSNGRRHGPFYPSMMKAFITNKFRIRQKQRKKKSKLELCYYRLSAVSFYLRLVTDSEMERSKALYDNFIDSLRLLDEHLSMAMCILHGRIDSWATFKNFLPSNSRTIIKYSRLPKDFRMRPNQINHSSRARRDFIALKFSTQTMRKVIGELKSLQLEL